LRPQARRLGDRRAGRGRLERDAIEPVDRGHEDRRLVEQPGSGRAVACGPDADPIRECARSRRPAAQGLRPQHDQLPLGQLAQLAQNRACESLARPPLEHDLLALRSRPEELHVDPGRDDPIVAGQAKLGSLGDL
jgi:hypothetical protein